MDIQRASKNLPGWTAAITPAGKPKATAKNIFADGKFRAWRERARRNWSQTGRFVDEAFAEIDPQHAPDVFAYC